MDAKALRTFLVSRPQPSKILVKCADDASHELAPAGPGRTWASIAQTIESLDPEAIALYDAEGKLIRATNFHAEAERKEVFADSLGVPGADNETARLTHFANLLYRATEFSTKLAFEKMVELFGMMNERSASIEARLEKAEAQYRKAMQDRLDDAFEQAEALQQQAEAEANDPVVGMVKQFAGGLAAGQASAPTNGARKQ